MPYGGGLGEYTVWADAFKMMNPQDAFKFFSQKLTFQIETTQF